MLLMLLMLLMLAAAALPQSYWTEWLYHTTLPSGGPACLCRSLSERPPRLRKYNRPPGHVVLPSVGVSTIYREQHKVGAVEQAPTVPPTMIVLLWGV
jgi:hypothetical protein